MLCVIMVCAVMQRSLYWVSLCRVQLCCVSSSWVSLCWVSLCWGHYAQLLCCVSSCWVSLYWVSYSVCRHVECHHAESRYAVCHHFECRHAESCYAECRCAVMMSVIMLSVMEPHLRLHQFRTLLIFVFRSQCYKTFFVRNNKHSSLVQKFVNYRQKGL